MTARILLVDDHELMRQGLRSILEKDPDFQVVGEAASGRDAVRRAAELRPDVVVMDVAMPDLNGVDATGQIRRADPGVQVVALSSHADHTSVLAMLRAGASAYVLKANTYAELRRAVHAVLAGGSFLCEEVAAVAVRAARRPADEPGTVWTLLGAREREVLQLIAEGLSSPEIAQRLHIAVSTVETHRRNLMRKLGLRGVADLTRYAVREGLVSDAG